MPPVTAGRLDNVGQLAAVCWTRSKRFPPLPPARPSHTPPHRGPSGSVARRILTGWFAVALWPVHMLVLTTQIPRVRVAGAASAMLTPTGVSEKHHRPGLVAIAATIGGLYLIALLGATQVVVFASTPWSLTALAALVIVLVLPGTVVIVDERRKRRQDPAGVRRIRSLNAWCTQLAGPTGQGYVLTDMAATRDGTGAGVRLLTALTTEWAVNRAVVTLYAATDELITYYQALGATRADAGDRRMYFDFRHAP